jgi:ArsR family metal-binding transcriptional regulator
MNHVTNIHVRSELNGALTIENDESTITVHPDGTVAISTTAPIQLTGESLGKLDDPTCHNGAAAVIKALLTRGKKA